MLLNFSIRYRIVLIIEIVNTVAYGSEMTKDKLSVNDWLEAAFRALTKGGPSAIKAEAIARDLGVSKGSFYWHFANVPALKSNMLSHWQEIATASVIKTLDQITETPENKLRQLISLSTSGLDDAYGGPSVEAAIRDWLRYDKDVDNVVKQVDAARIEFVEKLFQLHGLSKKQSGSYARLLYSALIGVQVLSADNLVKPKVELPKLLTILLNQTEGK